jgi:hypothetical protein
VRFFFCFFFFRFSACSDIQVHGDGSIVYREFQTLLAKEAICGAAQLRPELPDFFTPKLAQLLGTCWRHIPAERPDAGQLLALIQACDEGANFSFFLSF